MDFIERIDNKMQNIKYGWLDKNGNRHEKLTGFGEQYMLQLPDQLEKSQLGVCWDQVELERKLFADEKVKVRTFFIVHYDDDKCPTHTFLLFKHDGKTYWYDHSWNSMRGLHQYDDVDGALKDIKAKFIDDVLCREYNPDNLVVYEYTAPNKNLSCPEFYAHCEKGKKVKIKNKSE